LQHLVAHKKKWQEQTMAEYPHQQLVQQHLALRQQHQAVSQHQLRQVSEHQAPQVALAEAALEAHLSQRQQQ
jgi:hypothetical protein